MVQFKKTPEISPKNSNPEIRHDIHHVETDARGRYWADTDAGEAELTYTLGENLEMIVAGTFVPKEARGVGVASALVKRIVEDALRMRRKINPLCPFVARLFDRTPAWRELRV